MGAFPIPIFFRLSDEGVRCSEDGLFVGAVPLLLRSPRPGGGDSWAARPADELDCALGDLYGLSIDVTAKRDGLASVARAMESGDLALAKIAALLLRFPDPPSLAKGAPAHGALELAVRLFDSGLLKADWDPSKHPRRGEAPNRGWFTPTEDKPKSPKEGEPEPTGSERKLLRPLREALKGTALAIIETTDLTLWAASEIKDNFERDVALLEVFSPANMIQIATRTIEQARASLDPPKTLEELQKAPTQNALGYEVHHKVEQNPDNLRKSPVEVQVEKFGPDLIDAPNNLVWVPRLKHELITGYYNSLELGDPQRRLHRQVVNTGTFDEQSEAGLQALRRFGVLK
jgi:hypothetical protein